MRRITEDRMRRPDEDRAAVAVHDGPDPRNVATVTEWSVEVNGLVEVVRNFEEREVFGRQPDGPNPPYTVGEVRRGGLVGVHVLCPRDIDDGSHLVARRGTVLTWPQAVAFGVVEA